MAVKPFNVMNLGGAGLFDPKEMGYRDSLDIIKDESVKIQKSFVKIGWYLKHIRDDELYIEEGYANIYECAADQLGYSQSTVSRFINICEKFSKDKDSPELDEKYAGFDKSQMIEMLPLEKEDLEKVTPKMTVKEIREIKENKKKKAGHANGSNDADKIDLPGQTSIEEDFPEYMPDTSDSKTPDLQEECYATSNEGQEAGENELHEDNQATEDIVVGGRFGTYNVVDGTFKEKEMVIPWETAQPELPILKNNDQRKEWLGKYKEWGLWYRDDNIDVNYYKFDFDDGSRLVVAEYPQRHSYYSNKSKDEYYYHLLKKNTKRGGDIYDEKYRCQPDCETELIDFLKNLQRRI